MDMPRPKPHPTVVFVLSLYREMKPDDRRLLMMQLMASTFDMGNGEYLKPLIQSLAPMPKRPRGRPRKEKPLAETPTNTIESIAGS